MATCANPGCEQPGTNRCSACKTTPYCGPICQTANWIHHKEECPGHLRKVGMANLNKAIAYCQVRKQRNYVQQLRFADLAATQLKKAKIALEGGGDVSGIPVEPLDNALAIKYEGLFFLGRHKEALECAEEWYCLWPTKHTHPHAINASFALVHSCIENKKYFDAALYARTTWETITLSRDSHIPDNLREEFTARGASALSRALWRLAEYGDMPAEEKPGTGVEAIMLARRSLEIFTQLHGNEDGNVATSIELLACVLEFFNSVDDDEIIPLREQAIAINTRVLGCLSFNVAMCESNLGNTYKQRTMRAERIGNDLDRCISNMELALPHYREAARIYRAINRLEDANNAAYYVAQTEKELRNVTAKIAAESRG